MASEAPLAVRLHLTRRAVAKPRLLPTGVFRPDAGCVNCVRPPFRPAWPSSAYAIASMWHTAMTVTGGGVKERREEWGFSAERATTAVSAARTWVRIPAGPVVLANAGASATLIKRGHSSLKPQRGPSVRDLVLSMQRRHVRYYIEPAD